MPKKSSKQSAGILLFRRKHKTIEVLLVHPGGPFWKNKDLGAWSVPKGEIDVTENGLEAAKRELQEETGLEIDGEYTALHPIRQKSGKLVHAWAVEADIDPRLIRSNNFELEWPPRSGKIQEFPEVDKAEWFTVAEAKQRINASQAAFVEELAMKLKKEF